MPGHSFLKPLRTAWRGSRAVLCGMVVVWTHLNADAGWVVEGKLRYENHFMAPRPVAQNDMAFRVSSDGCRSLIRTTRLDSGDYVEALVEGGVIQTFYFFTATNLASGGKPVQTAEIAHREFPRADASNIGYLWLAYGSACYFDSRTTNRLAPLWIQDDPTLEKQGFRMEAGWLRENGERLPRQVIYLNDGMKRIQRGGVSVVEPWLPPFDRGFKQAIYEASNGTNLHGVFVPTDFTFTRNGLRPDGSGGFNLDVITYTEAKAEHVTEIAELDLASPHFVGTADIVDFRYADSNPAVSQMWFQVTNGNWPDTRQVGQAYEKQIRMREKASKAGQVGFPNSKRRWIIIALLAISSVTVALFIRSILRRGSPTKG